MRAICKVCGCLVVLFIAACVTVNVYFPAAEVQKAADKIVDDVRKKTGDTPAAPAPSSGAEIWKRFGFGLQPAYAQMNIDISTPAIRGLKDAMKNRFPQLKPLYDQGAVGENNNGLIELRDAAALNLAQRSQANRLIDQENSDRNALYGEIAQANKLGPESVAQIRKIFANSWREKSQAGWWVQNDRGGWEKK